MARPRKETIYQRTERLALYFTESEREQIKRYALIRGEAEAQAVRSLFFEAFDKVSRNLRNYKAWKNWK